MNIEKMLPSGLWKSWNPWKTKHFSCGNSPGMQPSGQKRSLWKEKLFLGKSTGKKHRDRYPLPAVEDPQMKEQNIPEHDKRMNG